MRRSLAIERTMSQEKSPGVTRLPNRLDFLKTSDGSLRFRNATYAVAVLVRPEFRSKKAKVKPKVVTVSTPARLDRQDEVELVGFWTCEWGE